MMATIITNDTRRRLHEDVRRDREAEAAADDLRRNRRGPMNLGPKDEPLTVTRGRLESILVALAPASQLEGGSVPPAAWWERKAREREAIRRILRGEA